MSSAAMGTLHVGVGAGSVDGVHAASNVVLNSTQPAVTSSSSVATLHGRSTRVAPAFADPVARAYAQSINGVGSASSVSAAPMSMHFDGSPRIVQASYWSQGIWTGIYYLFQYWFQLDGKERGVMDAIYLAVREAVEQEAEVDIQTIATAMQSTCNDDAAICDVMESYFTMVRHAFGYTQQAEELLLVLHTQRKDQQNMRFLDHLVKVIIGESIIEAVTLNLLPQAPSDSHVPESTCYEYLQNFASSAKQHPLYKKMQLALGQDPVCAEAVAIRALAIIKQNQLRWLNDVSGLLEAFGGSLGDASHLRPLHRSFDRHLALFLVRSDEEKALLQKLNTVFQVLDASNFATFVEFVKEQRLLLQRIVRNAQIRTSDIIGESSYKKLQAMLYAIEVFDDQDFIAVQKIIEKFTEAGTFFSALIIAAHFTTFETEIREEKWMTLMEGKTATQFLGDVCLKGFHLIENYLDPVRAKPIMTELIFWCIRGRLPALDSVPPASIQEVWSASLCAKLVEPLIQMFKPEEITSMLRSRVVDFNRICGAANIKALVQHLGNASDA